MLLGGGTNGSEEQKRGVGNVLIPFVFRRSDVATVSTSMSLSKESAVRYSAPLVAPVTTSASFRSLSFLIRLASLDRVVAGFF